MAKFALQRCPACRAAVPFAGATSTQQGVEIYRCPACGTQLRRKSDVRVTFGLLLVVLVACTFAFLPAWLWALLMVAVLIWELRWTFELVKVAE